MLEPCDSIRAETAAFAAVRGPEVLSVMIAPISPAQTAAAHALMFIASVAQVCHRSAFPCSYRLALQWTFRPFEAPFTINSGDRFGDDEGGCGRCFDQ